MSLGTPWQHIAGTPTHTPFISGQILSRFHMLKSLREGATNERGRKRVAWQRQPRKARRIRYLAAQHSIEDRSLQHAILAINKAPRGVRFVTALAVLFDNSVLHPPYARTNPTVPPQLPHCACIPNPDSSAFACFANQPVVVFRRYRATC
jgi:hypothetical protein